MLGKKISLFVTVFGLILVGAVSTNSASAMSIEELCDPNQPGAIVAEPGQKNIKGTNGDDIIIGNELDNKIDGKKGADVICGGDGNDDLRGGAQNDILLGQAGSDKFTGGQGVDTCDLSTEDKNEKNCELAFGGQDLGGDKFTDVIIDAFGNVDNFLNQFLKSDGTFNIDSFFDIFTEVSVHDADVGNLQNQIDDIQLILGPQGTDESAGPPGTIGFDELTNIPTGFADGIDDDTQYDGTNFAISGQGCSAGDVVTGIDVNGVVICASDQTESGDVTIITKTLYPTICTVQDSLGRDVGYCPDGEKPQFVIPKGDTGTFNIEVMVLTVDASVLSGGAVTSADSSTVTHCHAGDFRSPLESGIPTGTFTFECNQPLPGDGSANVNYAMILSNP